MTSTQARGGNGSRDPREIAKWANRYARSRTIPFLVQWMFVILLVVPMGVSCYFMLRAGQTGHPLWYWLFGGLTAAEN